MTMRAFICASLMLIAPCAPLLIAAAAQSKPEPQRTARTQSSPPAIDLAAQPTLFVVGYAHLDTQWRWTYATTIREYIPNTLHHNFALMDKYPHYVFNFGGSRRYEMMKEYYPDDYERLKTYVARGQWFPSGSSVDENDANVPSAESIIRHVLYGNRFFEREFGLASDEYMLPDCFGFPAALPSVLAHCGIKGFSTQKLTWGSAVGIPFKVGVWEGPDGTGVIAALDPGAYVGEVRTDLSADESWRTRIDNNGKLSGVYADYHYYGTGDQGGAPTERSVQMIEKSVAGAGPVKVVSGPADWMFKIIPPQMRERLPRYKGELLLTEHSAGSITSQAFMKRMNRKNELLADAAERAAVAAWWLGAEYPHERLRKAWDLVLGSQMHDILPGTSHPKAYEYSWNDELLAANQFAAVLTDSVSAVAQLLDSRGDGGGSHSPTIGNESSSPILVFNPLSIEREDVVEATIPWHGALPKDVRVLDPNGKAGPAQIVGFGHESLRLVFLARVGSVGFSVFQLVASEQAPQKNSLKITERSLENDRYRVTVNDAGDVAWIYDKRNNRELLSSPARLALLYEKPRQWPAWNMDWKDRQQPPRSYVGGPAKFRITERGPVRVALEITREHEGSTFVQTIRLAAGDAANRVEFDNTIDWLTRERSLKAAFPLTVSNPKATYDIQVGTIERDNNNDKRYENPSHQWFNLTDVTGDYGVTIANDCKYGSDKPDDSTLRLTLLYTPGASGDYQDQATQDLGRHHMLYAVAGHEGDWRTGGCESAPWMAARVNQPLIPFVISKHNGASALGRSFSLLKSSSANVMITAAKKAENDDRVIIRLRELTGENKAALVSMTRPIAQAASVDGQERRIADALIKDGELVTQLQGYGLSAYSVKCGDFDLAIETDHARGDRDTNSPRRHITESSHVALALDFDCDVASSDTDRADGSVESPAVTGASAMARGSSWSRSYPAEQLGTEIHVGPGMVQFKLGPVGKGQKNALRCRGQVIELPAGKFNRVELLAASSNGDRRATFTINQTPTEVLIPFWRGYIGQWDNRVWLGSVPEIAYSWPAPFGGLEPGYVKQAEVAWFSSHHHHHHHADWERSGNLAIETDKSRASGDSNTPNGTSSGDQYYEFCYLYRISLDIPANAGADGGAVLTLPQDEHVFLMAATAVADAPPRAIPAAPLFDLLDDRSQDAPRISPQAGSFADVVEVRIQPRMYGRADAIRYTLDGTNPAPDSPSVKADEPVLLNRSATIRAAAVDASGHMGPESLAHLEVNDRTPPRLLKASAGFNQPFVKLVFSEPLSKGDAGSTSNYAIEPQVKRAGDTAAHQEITVLAASVVDEPARASGVILTLTSPLESGSPYVLRIRNLKDESPAQNTIGDMNVALVAPAPVVRLSDIDSQHRGQPIHPTEKLPTKGDDPWTLNMFVRTDKQPPNRTIIAGFGACGGGAAPQADATGRYICKFGSGIHFWSHHADLQGNTPLDLNRWQMITATYDGKALRLYKDGALLSQREVALANDEPVVSIAPIDPWDKKRRFEGDIRELTIWDTALDDDAIKSLLTNLP